MIDTIDKFNKFYFDSINLINRSKFIEVRNSKYGLGVFAKKLIPKNTIFESSYEEVNLDKVPEAIQYYWDLPPKLYLGLGMICNGSSIKYDKLLKRNSINIIKRGNEFITTKSIKKDNELILDYGDNYFFWSEKYNDLKPIKSNYIHPDIDKIISSDRHFSIEVIDDNGEMTYKYNDGSSGIQFVTILDDAFKVPHEFQNEYTHDSTYQVPRQLILVAIIGDQYRLVTTSRIPNEMDELVKYWRSKIDNSVELKIIDRNTFEHMANTMKYIPEGKLKELTDLSDIPLYARDPEDKTAFTGGLDRVGFNMGDFNSHLLSNTVDEFPERTSETFSGMTEIAPVMEGASYGHPVLGGSFNKTELDIDGFNIPRNLIKEFKLNEKGQYTKSFADSQKINLTYFAKMMGIFDWVSDEDYQKLIDTFNGFEFYKTGSYTASVINDQITFDFKHYWDGRLGIINYPTNYKPNLPIEVKWDPDKHDWNSLINYINESKSSNEKFLKSVSLIRVGRKVNYLDLDAYNKWIEDKSKDAPELSKEFDSIDEYIQFMINYKNKVRELEKKELYRETNFSNNMVRIFSPRVTDRDIIEFNAWIKSKSDEVPRLRKFFKSDKDYEDFMIDYQDKKLLRTLSSVMDREFSGSAEMIKTNDYELSIPSSKLTRLKKYLTPRVDKLFPNRENLAIKFDELKPYLVKVKLLNWIRSFNNLDYSYYIDAKIAKINGNSTQLVGVTNMNKLKSIKSNDEVIVYSNDDISWKLIPELSLTGYLVSNLSHGQKTWLIPDDLAKALIIDASVQFAAYQANLKSAESIKKKIESKVDKLFEEFENNSYLIKYIKDNYFSNNLIFQNNVNSFSGGKCPEDGCIQKDGDKWMIISNKTGEPWKPRYETREKAENALKAYHANKGFSSYKDDVGKMHDKILTYLLGLQRTQFQYTDEVKSYLKKVLDNFSSIKGFIRSFADPSLTVDNDPSIVSSRDSLGNMPGEPTPVKLVSESPVISADWNFTKPFNLAVEPWFVANVINDKADGLYVGELQNDKIELGKDHISIDMKNTNSEPTSVFAIIKNGKIFVFKKSQLESRDKTFSDGLSFDYRFSIVPTEISYEMSYVIGSWMLASSVCHLYHICDQKYAGHMALDEFYKDFPEHIDALAEHYLADNDKAEFRVCVVPHEDPIDYLTRLVQFTTKYSELNKDKIPSAYQSQIDDIVNFTQGILYKLKRLGNGRRIFSVTKTYSITLEDCESALANVTHDPGCMCTPEKLFNQLKALNLLDINITPDQLHKTAVAIDRGIAIINFIYDNKFHQDKYDENWR